MHLKDHPPTVRVRWADHHPAVEPAGTQQRRVKDLGPVSGSEDNHTLSTGESIHLGEDLVERLLPLVHAPDAHATTSTADGIQLVNEDDRRRCVLRRLEPTLNWINGYPSDHDYGLIKLTCDIGYSTGWFGWWYNPSENLVNQSFYVEGYPGDKPYGTMWWDGDTSYSQTANKLWYWVDTAGGQSGSPVYHYNSVTPGLCGGWCVTGIHTNGVVGGNPANSGTRFRPDVMSFINFWINQP